MNKSFTLIEILVVIVVVGILSSFILVGMSSITSSANIAKSKAFSNSLRDSLLMNLVSEWKLDGNGVDSWGSNTGTLYGTPTLKTSSDCVSEGCYQFDGINDYIDCGNNPSLWMRNNDHTASFWVRFDGITSTQYEVLIGCSTTGTTSTGYWIYRPPNTNGLYLYFNNGSAHSSGGLASVLATNSWLNIVITMDRDGLAKAYINGQIQSNSFDMSSYVGDIQNAISLRIGGYDSSNYRLAGRMDDVKIYHAIHSSFLINEEYYSGINKLFKNNGITLNEFNQRIVELKSNLSQNGF